MTIKRIKDFPEGSGSLSSDDIFLFMDDPSNGGTTKKISLSQISNAININGNYAILENGRVPAAQLPSYVDDVIEFINTSAFPTVGETGKIYTSLNNNKIYRWSGSSYIEISPSPGSTDSVAEGSVNLYYTNARASSAAPVQSVAGRTGNITLSVGDITSAVSSSDARLSDNRTPTDNSVTDVKISSSGLSPSVINWSNITAWTPNTAYNKGDLVYYLGIAYRRSSTGTSGNTFVTNNWQQVTAPINVATTPTQITSNIDNYALLISTADIFRISSDAARNITGITAGLYDGHAILLRNVGSFTITLTHQDSASLAANRIISPWSASVSVSPNSSIVLIYDNTLSKWFVT